MLTSENAPFQELRYCVRCCLPETSEGIDFDELGICKACRSSEMKMHINWVEREKRLRKLLEETKAKAGDNYDCLVPISGGKDSYFQLHVLRNVYGVKPLTCTFSHNWWTETGKWNLQNCLEVFDVDHVMFTPSRGLINKIARKSLCVIGDACWHCHAGVGAYPLKVASQYKVPLLIWGESAAEFGSKATYEDQIDFDETYYLKVSMKVDASKMVDGEIGLTDRDLFPFRLPTREEIAANSIRGIHLGDYIFWDGERQMEFLKKEYGWREDHVEGTYKGYKSVECRMAGVHDYSKWVKRGFGRATDHASIDVRNGLMSREEGLKLAKRIDAERPEVLDYYLEITGYTEEEFLDILESQRQGQAKELPKVPRPGERKTP
ncbi:MAG: N-acetyl sugar amidotransferase [bacterium]